MKYLILTLTMILGLLLPNFANAQSNVIPWPQNPQLQQKPPVPYWSPGEILRTSLLCKDEETIRKIVLADMESKSDAVDMVRGMLAKGLCMGLPARAPFVVDELLFEYTDYQDLDCVAMKVSIDTGGGIIKGYAISIGKIKPAI